MCSIDPEYETRVALRTVIGPVPQEQLEVWAQIVRYFRALPVEKQPQPETLRHVVLLYLLEGGIQLDAERRLYRDRPWEPEPDEPDPGGFFGKSLYS